MHKISRYPILDNIVPETREKEIKCTFVQRNFLSLVGLWRYALAAICSFLLVFQASATQAHAFFDLVVNDLNGEPQSMAKYQGRPIVVNFWATWCPPCVKEMPDLEALSKEYKNVQFVGLAIDTQRNVKRFLQEIKVSYDLYVPGHSGVNSMKALGNTKAGLPFTLVIDEQGVIQHQLLGQINKAELAQLLQ